MSVFLYYSGKLSVSLKLLTNKKLYKKIELLIEMISVIAKKKIITKEMFLYPFSVIIVIKTSI